MLHASSLILLLDNPFKIKTSNIFLGYEITQHTLTTFVNNITMNSISLKIANLLNAEMPPLHTLDTWEELSAMSVDNTQSPIHAEDNMRSKISKATDGNLDRDQSWGKVVSESFATESYDSLIVTSSLLATCLNYCYQRTLYYETLTGADIPALGPAATLTKAQKRARAKREARRNKQEEPVTGIEKDNNKQTHEDDQQGPGNAYEGLIKFSPLRTNLYKPSLNMYLLVKDHIDLCRMATTYVSSDDEFEKGFDTFIHPLLHAFFLVGQPLNPHMTEDQQRNSKVQLVFTGKDDCLNQGQLCLTHKSWRAYTNLEWFSLVDNKSRRQGRTRDDNAGVLVTDTTLGNALDFLEFVESLEAEYSENTRVLMIQRKCNGSKFDFRDELTALKYGGQGYSETEMDTNTDTETSKSHGLSSDMSFASSGDDTEVSELGSKGDDSG